MSPSLEEAITQIRLSHQIRLLHLMELPQTKWQPLNKAENKMMPHIMVKTMRLPQKIMLAKKIWQDYNSSSYDGAASYKEAASQDKALSSKDDAA